MTASEVTREKVPVYYKCAWCGLQGPGCIYGPVIKCDSAHLSSCHSQAASDTTHRGQRHHPGGDNQVDKVGTDMG